MPNHFYPPVGRCIYCGATALPAGVKRFGDEHIIPLALGGSLILKEAACRKCEKIINEEIESPVLLKEWVYLRVKRNFPTRGKSKKRPTYVTLRSRDGAELRIPIQDYSAPVPAYKFIPPRILSGAPRIDNNKHWSMDILTDHDSELQMRSKYPQWDGTHAVIPQPFRFARLLAKIAYCRAVAEYGIDGFKPLALDVILGHSDDYFLTVGGSLDSQPAVPGGDHVLDLNILFRSSRLAHLIIDVRLFSQIVSPAYRVVAGEINLDNPRHLEVLNRHQGGGKLVAVPTSAAIA
ncbi:HNH endonuclease [Methyloversatilis sp.]|uniref:HNH endonuclease n=1 Tax=Methyloversatilis sp. TaxID=2569862 RepID=UPI003D2DDAE9